MNRRGFSLIAVLVTGSIVVLIFFFLTQLLSVTARNTKHTDIKLAIASLIDTVRDTTDCAETFRSIDVSTDCRPGAPKPVQLVNKYRNSLTGPVSTAPAIWNPVKGDSMGNFSGSGTIGSWSLRAYCDNVKKTLIVRFARNDGKGNFYIDPLLKRPYDWSDSTQNPILGAPDRVFCSDNFASTPSAPPASDCISVEVGLGVGTQNSSASCNGMTPPRKITSGGCKIIGGDPTDQDLTMSYPDLRTNRWVCQSSNTNRPTFPVAICCL